MAIRNPWETKSLVFNDFEQKKLAKPFTAKLMDSEGAFSGTGMVFDSQHPTSNYQLGPEWKDRVRPGAFSLSLAEHKAAGTMPLMLFMHQRGYIPGVWKSIAESKEGLVLEGLVHKLATTPSNVPLLELMKMGAITGLSIGFRPRKVSLDEETKVRDILDVELGEISIVDIPGSSVSRITDVKKDLRGLELVLRQAGLSRREAKALLANGAKALMTSEDEGGDKVKELLGGIGTRAASLSDRADRLSKIANKEGGAKKHQAAADAHMQARSAHKSAAEDDSTDNPEFHNEAAATHTKLAGQHQKKADNDEPGESGDSSGDKDKNPDGINRDDVGRFATKALDDLIEKLGGEDAKVAKYKRAAKVADDKTVAAGEADARAAKLGGPTHAAAIKAHQEAADAHAVASAAARDTADQSHMASFHDQQAATARVLKGDAEKRQATSKEKHPDDINRDDHGRFANKAATDSEEELSTSVVKSIHALRDAVADPSTVQRDADPVNELKRFAQFLKSHLPQE